MKEIDTRRENSLFSCSIIFNTKPLNNLAAEQRYRRKAQLSRDSRCADPIPLYIAAGRACLEQPAQCRRPLARREELATDDDFCMAAEVAVTQEGAGEAAGAGGGRGGGRAATAAGRARLGLGSGSSTSQVLTFQQQLQGDSEGLRQSPPPWP